MNSPFANIFLAVQQRLQDIVPAITYIDQDLGQLRNEKIPIRPAVSWPCVLIDFDNFAFDNLSENVQTTTGSIVLRLGFTPFSSSSQASPDAYKEMAISYYDIEWNINKALQGWTPGNDFGYLSRISTKTEKRYDNIRVRELRYTIAFEDYSTANTITYVSAAMVIDPEIEID